LRALLNDPTIVLRDEDSITKLIGRFNFTVEFMTHQDMIQLPDEQWTERKANGVVMVPADDKAGREFLRKRNVAVMALWKLKADAQKLVVD
jgi:hypothetical protein